MILWDEQPLKEKGEKMGHTPGPWAIQPSSDSKNGTGWRDIVSLGQEYSPSYVGEALERDAHLIAAAPDLLKALKGVLHHDDGLKDQYKISPSLINQVRKAVEKAEGKGG